MGMNNDELTQRTKYDRIFYVFLQKKKGDSRELMSLVSSKF